MKVILITLFISLVVNNSLASDFSNTYAESAYRDYSLAKSEAQRLQQAIQIFLRDTTSENLEITKQVWTEARKVYSTTEIYRFYGGPIDNEEGPEGLINAWPLDEAYIDYVKGNSKTGIINQVDDYPQITKELLIELNEKEGEKNISTGWHAIEFLLWGQDFNIKGPGSRSVSDFQEAMGKNAERRRAYLEILAELLVENLDSVVQAWDKTNSQSYYNQFVNSDEQEALTKAFTSLISMSSDELAIERMFVAYDTQFQEDEHSCFSDTTQFDLLFNFMGIKNLWNDLKNTKQISEDLVKKIDSSLDEIEFELTHFKGPFDQAIFEEGGRKQILFIVNSLQEVGEDFKKVASEFGIIL